MIPVLIFLGSILDSSRFFLEYNRLKSATDSAVLAMAQELPVKEETSLPAIKEIGKTAIEYNITEDGRIANSGNGQIETLENEGSNISDLEYSIDFYPGNDGVMNTVMVNAHKTLNVRLMFLGGIDDWTIASQSMARSGPIERIKNWVPIGIYIDPNNFDVYSPVTLSNNVHNLPNGSTQTQYSYVTFNRGDIRAAFQSKTGINGAIKVGNQYQINNSSSNALNICEGYNNRIQIEFNVRGCQKVGDSPINTNYVGAGEKKDWNFGNDPRLMYIPVIKNTSVNNTVEVVGFALMYVQYMHYDPTPYGSSGGPALTEFVGYFVQSVVEGPILNLGNNYGVIGIEYLDTVQ